MREELAYEVDFERAAPRYRHLPAPVRRILKLCDGTRPLAQLVAMSPIDAERTQSVLRRLAELGLIVPRVESRPPAPLAFSSDEQSFFDSSIDHLVVDEFAE